MTDHPISLPGSRLRSEMHEQPAVLTRVIDRVPQIATTVAALRPADLAGSLFLGRGSSDNAAVLGRYLAEMWSGRPAGLSAASVVSRYGAVPDHTGYVASAFSQSGRTPEIVAVAERVRSSGGRVVAVCADSASPLAAAADVVVDLDTGPERAVPASKTVTAQLVASIAIAAGLSSRPDADAARALVGLPDAVAQVLGDPAAVDRVVARWHTQRRLLVVARGLQYAAALEIALKVREIAGVLAQGISTADLLHGPIAAVAPGDAVLVLDPPTEVSGLHADITEIAARLSAVGADVVRCGPGAELAVPDVSELGSVIAAVVRGQQLALAWGLAIGVDPDAPSGLSKVTLTQ